MADGVSAAPHKLKSSFRTAGVNALSDLCATLEITGIERDWETLKTCLPQLEGALAKVTAYINTL